MVSITHFERGRCDTNLEHNSEFRSKALVCLLQGRQTRFRRLRIASVRQIRTRSDEFLNNVFRSLRTDLEKIRSSQLRLIPLIC